MVNQTCLYQTCLYWIGVCGAMFCLLNIRSQSFIPVGQCPRVRYRLQSICCLERYRYPTSYHRSYGRPTAVNLAGLLSQLDCTGTAGVSVSVTSWRVWMKSGRCSIRSSTGRPSSSGLHISPCACVQRPRTRQHFSCSLNLLVGNFWALYYKRS